MCGADSFVAIEHFGQAREACLKTFFDLPNGISSHDTIGRIFALLDPKALEEAFRRWTAAIATLDERRGFGDRRQDSSAVVSEHNRLASVHMVSAWAATTGWCSAEIKIEDNSNEITAIPRLLELLRIEGCLVTIDAMGCQKEIASKIVDRGADYMLAVKDNQPTLSATISAIFEEALRDPDFPTSANHSTTTEKAHGRTEVRRCWTMDIDSECGAPFDEWTNVRSIVLVERERTIGDKTSIERCHYIASRLRISAKAALAATRAHWGIENQLHWVLDVAFREDDCRVRAGHAAENFAVIRHIALNLLKAVPGGLDGKKLGVKNKRLLAGWHDGYLLRVLGVMS